MRSIRNFLIGALFGATFYVMGLADTIRNTQATDILNAIDSQTAHGTLKIYSGTRPSKNGTVTTLLSTLTFNKPSFSAASGVLTLITSPAISDTNAAASGTATWARFQDGGGNFVADIDVGVSGQLTFDNYAITAGGTVNLTGGTITIGNA